MSTKIIMDDLRSAGIGTCRRARQWCEQNGVSWRGIRDGQYDTDYVRNLTETECSDDKAYLLRLADAAEARASNGR